jgi:hypothetical protein
MGKRELLLFLGFLAFGAIVYQATAPPPEQGKEGFSFSKFMGDVKAELKGEQAEFVIERTTTADAPSGEGRLVIPGFRGTLTILGENRHDLSAELKATVYGMDDDQTKARAKEVNLTLQEHGEDLKAEVTLPSEFHRRPQLQLTLHVPAHLAVTLELRNGQADLRRVGQVLLQNSRGKITMADVGEVDGSIETGNLEIVHAASVTLKLMRTQARLEEINGELTLEADHGDLRLVQLHGPTKLTLERLDCEIDQIHAPLRVEPTHVGLSVRNVSAPLIVKGERSSVLVTLNSAVPVEIETSDELIDLRAPHDGVTIDARTENGQIRVADAGSATGHDETSNASKDEDKDKKEGKDEDIEKSDKDTQKDKSQKEKAERTEKLEKMEKEHVERRERREMREPRERPELPEPRERPELPEPPPPPPPAPPAQPAMPRDDNNSRVRRATIKLHGGGPLIKLHNERGDIVIR